MNKTEVTKRIGWTAGRVDKFLVVEYQHYKHGWHGSYVEDEYSIAQVLKAERLPAWRKAAAQYLRIGVEQLDAKIAELEARSQKIKEERDAELAAFDAQQKAKKEAEAARIAKFEAEVVAPIAARVRGGLRRIGFSH